MIKTKAGHGNQLFLVDAENLINRLDAFSSYAVCFIGREKSRGLLKHQKNYRNI